MLNNEMSISLKKFIGQFEFERLILIFRSIALFVLP